MNARKRKEVREADALLSRAVTILEMVMDDERDCLSNMPENLQNGERCSSMEDAIDALEDAIYSIGEASDKLNGIL